MEIWVIYAVIVFAGFIDYIRMQLTLKKWLYVAFAKCRSQKGMLYRIFNDSYKTYFLNLMSAFIPSFLVIFSAFNLLKSLDMLTTETAILLVGLAIFYVKEKVFFQTAFFVVHKGVGILEGKTE